MKKTFVCSSSRDDPLTLLCNEIEPQQSQWRPEVETCLPVTDGLVDFWVADREPCPISPTTNVAEYCGAIAEGEGFTRESGYQGDAFAIRGSGVVATVQSVPELEPEFLTVTAWVRGPQPTGFVYIVAKGADACEAPSYGLYATPTPDEIRFIVYDGANFGIASAIVPGIWDGEYHQVVGSYDGTEVALYVDGLPVDTTPYTGTIDYDLPTSDDLTIGGYTGCPPGDNNLSFPGDIDEIALYDRALTAQEILDIYNAGADENCAN